MHQKRPRNPARRLPHGQVFPDRSFRLNVMRVPAHGTSPEQHGHEFHELVVILDGRGKHVVGREGYAIETGDVFVILPDTTHAYVEAERLSLINILFDPGRLDIPRADLGDLPGYHALFTVEPSLRGRQRFHNRLRLDMDELAQAAQTIAAIEDELRARSGGYRFAALAHLMKLMAFLSRCYTHTRGSAAGPVTQISEVLGHMERHYSEPLAVRDLMAVAHASQTSLMRSFRRVLGRSPVDYLIRLRVSKAQALLRSTHLSIKEIAGEVGFDDSNYFTRQFRRVTGHSPRDFRRHLAASAGQDSP